MKREQVDFHRNPGQGQLVHTERECLYDLAIKFRPKNILEIGTWKGGGSTYILACAAHEYGGMLHTIECNEIFLHAAIHLYHESLSDLQPNIVFYHAYAQDIIYKLASSIKFEMFFFDGAENESETLLHFEILSRYFTDGDILACHDWNIGKMKKVRPIIESNNWTKLYELNDTPTGFCALMKGAI